MAFDRYMIQAGAGRNPKLAPLTIAERYAYFLGLLSLASRANPRGSLQIGNRMIGWQDVARECAVRGQVANRMLAKARQIGLIESSDDGLEWVHDFEHYNPDPRSDATNAERQRRFRERHKSRYVTLRNAGEVEVEVEEKKPPTPPFSSNGVTARSDRPRSRGKDQAPRRTQPRSVDTAAQANRAWWLEALPEFPASAVNHAIRALRSRGEPLSVEAVRNHIIEGEA